MRVLVTGSRGFIGSVVCAQLTLDGHEVIHYDTPLNILSSEMLSHKMSNVDAVINLAGVLGTAEMIGSERKAAEVNILGALAIYDEAALRGIPVVQIGTGHKGQPNPYAITKGAAEDLGLARAQWCGEKIAVVRAYHVYGPGQKACPPHGKSQVRKIIPSFVCRALTGMPLEINGYGDQLIDLVYVTDVAKSLVQAISGPYGMVHEAGTGIATSVNDAASDVIQACGSNSQIHFVPMRDGEPVGAVVVAEAAIYDQHRWPYMLHETIEWYREYLRENGTEPTF